MSVSKPPPFDVLVIDNSENVHRSLRTLPEEYPAVVRTLRSATSIKDSRFDREPLADVIILDLMLGQDNENTSRRIPQLSAGGARVLLYTQEVQPILLQEALHAGALGLCSKHDSIDTLVRGINEVGQGRPVLSEPLAKSVLKDAEMMRKLTPAESSVLRGISLGLSVREVAEHRNVEPTTVDSQTQSIRRKIFDAATASNGRHLTADDLVTEEPASTNVVRMVVEAIRMGFLDPRDKREAP